jgi:MerR family transcriptional regulator, light-induced transcriptional regulator
MEHPSGRSGIRIGELSRRLGLSEHVIRAWERRYGLLRPARSEGGFRLYSEQDERMIRRMQRYRRDGFSAAEAARAALAEDDNNVQAQVRGRGDPSGATGASDLLRVSLDQLDEQTANAELDRLLATFTTESVLRDVLLPYLRELGQRWEQGEIDVGHEHFASNLIRGRLAGLARGWGTGSGPRAVLACPPGELHDLGLMIFGIVLGRAGWRISYLGADTPGDGLDLVVRAVGADLVVLSATRSEPLEDVRRDLRALSALSPLLLAGEGADPSLAREVGARTTEADPVSAAQHISRSIPLSIPPSGP